MSQPFLDHLRLITYQAPYDANGINPYFLTGSFGLQNSNPIFTLDVNGSINFTDTMYKNGIPWPSLFTGATGASGISFTGPTGAAGTQGLDGATGPTGAAGTQGLDGATGPTGAAGTQGLDGATGPTGPQGEIGPSGFSTNTGATGPQGQQGDPGISTGLIFYFNYPYQDNVGSINPSYYLMRAIPTGGNSTSLTTSFTTLGETQSVVTFANASQYNNISPLVSEGIWYTEIHYSVNTGSFSAYLTLSAATGATSTPVVIGTSNTVILNSTIPTISSFSTIVNTFQGLTSSGFVTLTLTATNNENFASNLTTYYLGTTYSYTTTSLSINLPAGPTGPQGLTGSIGATGPQGLSITGPTGPQGLTGPTGPQGFSITGATGATGITGATGPQGPIGATGTFSGTVTFSEGPSIPSAANIDNYNLPENSFFKISGTTSSNVNGFANGTSGRLIIVVNNTDKNQTFVQEAVSSTGSNRFVLGVANKTIGVNQSASFIYVTGLTVGGTGAQSRWVLTATT